MSTLIFILAFAGLIIIHELGHFIAAKLVKIKVEEFGLGLPPKLFTLFKWQETEFTFNAIPLGGFVRPAGENDPNIEGGLASSSPWSRLFVLSAGPFMNLVAGIIVFSIIFTQTGVPDTSRVLIFEVMPNSPAEAAGFQPNDYILSVNGTEITNSSIAREIIYASLDTPVTFIVLRGETELTLVGTPSSKRKADEGALGVGLGNPIIKTNNWLATIPISIQITGEYIKEFITLPSKLISGAIPREQARLLGLAEMHTIFSQAIERDTETRVTPPSTDAGMPDTATPTFYTLSFIATLSLSLGFFNLLPIPALDGGRILFVLPEILFRRRVPQNIENGIHTVAYLLLLGLMIFVNVRSFISPADIILP